MKEVMNTPDLVNEILLKALNIFNEIFNEMIQH